MNKLFVKREDLDKDLEYNSSAIKVIEATEAKDKKIQNYLESNLLSLKGTKKLGDLYLKVQTLNRKLSEKFPKLEGIIDDEIPINNGNQTSDVEVEFGQDLAVNELGKYNNTKTKKQYKHILSLRHQVLKHPNSLITYISTWKMSKHGNGPVDLKFAVEFTSPIFVTEFISKALGEYDNEIEKLVTQNKSVKEVL